MTRTFIRTPVGGLALHSDGSSLTGILFGASPSVNDETDDVLELVRRQLAEYFEGSRTAFDLPLTMHGTTFQRDVWSTLLTIPYGQTTTYGAIAEHLGLGPVAARAVGSANGANPIPIVVPCHRVIGANGSLTGFGGGLERKRVLLDLETPTLFSPGP